MNDHDLLTKVPSTMAIHRTVSRRFLVLISLLTPFLLDSCGFSVPDNRLICKLLNETKIAREASSTRTKVFESSGTLVVYHGSMCAVSNKSGQEDVLILKGNLALPAYATKAAVFLNGWESLYIQEDHHVSGLAFAIDSIRLNKNNLTWRAMSILSDDNFDDGYEACYTYTVVAWNPTNINLLVDQSDINCGDADPLESNFFYDRNDDTENAHTVFSSFLYNKDFINSKKIAILPRGFGFNWPGEDHHIHQLAYHIGHSELFIENGKKYSKNVHQKIVPSLSSTASEVGTGYVSWESSVIMKDNDARRIHDFGEIVSGLGGTDLGVIEPPFSVRVHAQNNAALASAGVRTEKFMITNIPYNYAIPILSGWDLRYVTSDNHMRRGGAWIHNIQYDKNPAAATGTLRYELSTALLDDDNMPDFASRHKVTVLGFHASTGKGVKARKAAISAAPDLIPYSPQGNSSLAFSRLEQGKRLRITIKNQGNEHAGPSKTTLTLDGRLAMTYGTDAIPIGGSVDVLFDIPAGYTNADTSFTITVDSASEVNEGDNESNNRINGAHLGPITLH